LANIGSSIQGVNFPEMAQQAMQMQAYRQQQAGQQAVAAVAAQHPAKQGETREEAYNRLIAMATEIAAIPGVGPGIAERFAPLIQAVKPDRPQARREPMRVSGVNTKLGTAGIGQTGTLLIDPDSLQQIGFIPGAPKEPTPVERTAGSQFESASGSVAHMREIAGRNPEAAKAAAAAVHAGGWGRLGKAYAALRGFTNDKDANDFYTEYKNMILTVTPTYGGARPTQQLMDLEQAASLPAIGSGDFDTAFRHMEQRLADLKAKAGRGLQPQAATPRHPGNPFR